MLFPLQGLGVDEEEQVGDPQQGEKDQGGSDCSVHLQTLDISSSQDVVAIFIQPI